MILSQLIVFLLVGGLAGWISGLLTKGTGFGFAGNIIVGIVGAFLGNFAFGVMGIVAFGLFGRLVFAVLGALFFLWLLRFIRR
jgi:uncharacterized membrane protein YeaQ/YmgE (transglycosylase-associated protein family)